MKHWARDLIGRRWSPDGDGPATYSCWGLVREAARRRLGVELPPAGEVSRISARVAEIRCMPFGELPREDDIVTLRSPSGLHVGFIVRGNGRIGMLHAAHDAGVIWEPWGPAIERFAPRLWRRDPRGRGSIAEAAGAQDKEDFRGLLQIAAIASTLFLGPGPLTYALTAASFAYNLLVPPSQQQLPPQPGATGNPYSTSLQGNQAKLDQAIPRICGRREVAPPFACQPYTEYRARDGAADPDLDQDQFFFALYAVGIGGNHDVFAKIGNTPVSRFADVLVAQYLAPGEQPSMVEANVTTAEEVSGQILESFRYVGGFAACAPGRTVTAIGIDIIATRGLGKTGALTVSWRVETREINDFGQVMSPWTVALAGSEDESRTAFTNTPQRWSVRYELATGTDVKRVEVRVVRTDVQDTDPSALHEIAWGGLRAYLAEPAPLHPNVAHYEIVLRASAQLSSIASRDLRLIVKAFTSVLEAGTDAAVFDSEEVHTRNPAWWLLDLATSEVWGLGKPLERIDFQSFVDLAATCEMRQDRFDYVFDARTSAWDAMQLIARSCRARVFRRNGVLSVARDELTDLPEAAFTLRNCLPNMSVDEKLRRTNSPDGCIVEYQDHRTWEWTPIEVPCPGTSEMLNPIRIRLEGVTGATHAHREGLYEAANLLYRSRTAAWSTEMHGVLPAYMSPVDFLPDTPGYGQAGDVVDWDEDTLTVTLSEPIEFDSATYIRFERDDGTLTDPILLTPATDSPNQATLDATPDFSLIFDDAERERTKYLLGACDRVKIIEIADGGTSEEGAQLFSLRGVIDDDRVHAADNALLPDTDEIQDPVGNPDGLAEGDSDMLLIVYVIDHTIAITSNDPFQPATARYRLDNNGVAGYFLSGSAGSISADFTNEWIMGRPVDASTAGLYEARATILSTSFSGGLTSGTTGSWLALNTSRTWQTDSGGVEGEFGVVMLIEIREIATGIVQDSARITLAATQVGAP